MAKVNYGYSIQVTGGPQIAQSRATTVQAYDKIDISLDPGATDVVVSMRISPVLLDVFPDAVLGARE